MNASTPPPEVSPPLSWRSSIMRRVLTGMIGVIPLLLTFAILYYLYSILNEWVIEPVAALLMPARVENLYWQRFEVVISPILSLLAVFLVLYFLGYVFSDRMNRLIGWLFDRIPGVATVYKALSEVAQSFQGPKGLRKVDTVVLVPFPHEKTRMAGYLMGASEDEATGEPLVCVYIPISLFPPSGYTLIYPKDEVSPTDWKSEETWKLLLSGGLTIPEKCPYQTPKEKAES